MAGKLQDLNVVVTRQANATDDLNAMINAHGGRCVNLPLFAIEAILDCVQLRKIETNLQTKFLTICISRNAAAQVLPRLKAIPNTQWATIGPATAKYLQKYNIQQVICPQHAPFDSKTLLLELQLKSINLKDLCIMILTGEQGDNWLSEELQRHGATVEVMQVYRRIMPQISVNQFKNIISTIASRNVVLITCATSLVNLQTLALQAGINIYNMPLLVVSDRIHAYAKAQGFVNISLAKSTMAADIVSALLQYR